MVEFRDKVLLVAALVVSAALGASVGYALQPASAPALTSGADGHVMTPEEQCQHMPEMCPPPGGNRTA